MITEFYDCGDGTKGDGDVAVMVMVVVETGVAGCIGW